MLVKRHILNGAVGVIFARVVGTILSFSLAVLLARVLGAEGYGIYAFVFSVLAFFTIPLQAGFPNLTVRETAKSHSTEDWGKIRGLRYWTLRNIIIYSLGFWAVFEIVASFDLEWLNSPRVETFNDGILAIPLAAIVLVQGAMIRGFGRWVLGVLPDAVLRPGITLALILYVLSFGPQNSELTPSHAIVLYVGSLGISALISHVFVQKIIANNAGSNVSRSLDAPAWRNALVPLTMVGGIQILYGYSDLIILGLFHGDEEVGVYRSVGQLAMLVIFGLSAINQMLHPLFAKIHLSGNIAQLQKLVYVSSLFIFFLAAVPAVFLMFFGGYILTLVFGPEFSSGATSLAILSAGQLANAAFGSVGALLNMTGHEKDAMRGMLYTLVINISLAFILVPPFGIEGAALSTALSLVLWNVILRFFVVKRLQIESVGLIFCLRNMVKK